MIITIGRECGCQGDEFAALLAEQYHFPYYNKKAILQMAREEGILEKHPDFFGEVPVDTLLYTIASIENEDFLIMVPGNALSMLKKKKAFVLVGRCGNVVFGKEPDVMRIFLTGNKEERIKTIAQKHNISERKAKRLVEETDARRAAYHKRYTNETWGDAGSYDLCINISQIGMEHAVKLVQDYLEYRV